MINNQTSIDSKDYKKYEKVYQYALEETKKTIHQACEAFLHNAGTLTSRSGNQLPFSSVNYGTCTLKEGQLFDECLLDAWDEGIGELHLTPIFPCGIFQMMDGVNTKPEDPNYYLFQKALKVLPKRDYPNFMNTDWSTDKVGFDKSQDVKKRVIESLDESTLNKVKALDWQIQETLGFHFINDKLEMNNHSQPFEIGSTMGSVAGKEKVKIKDGGAIFTMEIANAWKYFSRQYNIEKQYKYDKSKHKKDLFIRLADDVYIWDNKLNNFTKLLYITKNYTSKDNWVRVFFQSKSIIVTKDHKFTTENRGDVLAENLVKGDEIYIDESSNGVVQFIDNVKLKDKWSYDVTTESEHFEVSGVYSHNCRTYNGFDANFDEKYFLNKVLLPTIENNELPLDQLWSGNQKDGRGNIAPNTIVLPFYAMEAKKKAIKNNHPEYAPEYFLELLDKAIFNSKEELVARFNWIAAQPKTVSKYMYCDNHTMLGWDEDVGIFSSLKHGTLVIGQLGLAEALQILIGCDQTDPKGMELAERIETLYNKRCAEFKNEVYYRNITEDMIQAKMGELKCSN